MTQITSTTRCPDCHKLTFTSRTDAKRYRNRRKGQRPYECPTGRGWHLGHIAKAVANGTIEKEEWEAQVHSEDREPTSSVIRAQVKARDGGRCVRCGARGKLDYSHRRTRSVKDDHCWCPCNGVMACRTCHQWMHKNPAQARREGWHVTRYEPTPAAVPVLVPTQGWMVLQCDGGSIPLYQAEVSIDVTGKPGLTSAAFNRVPRLKERIGIC